MVWIRTDQQFLKWYILHKKILLVYTYIHVKVKEVLRIYRFCITSPSATLANSKQNLLCNGVFIVVFIVFDADPLARGISLYHLLGDWLHRPWPYANQAPTTYEADALSTRPLLSLED